MFTPETIIIIFIIIVIFLPLRFLIIALEKARLRTSLQKRNLHVLEIVLLPHKMLLLPSTSYEVTYLTSSKNLYKARYHVVFPFVLSWTEPVYLGNNQSEQLQPHKYSSDVSQPPTTKSEKEKIIDGLTSNYRHERLWTVKYVMEMEHVDEQIKHVLREMSREDHERDVQIAAREAINRLTNT